MRWLVIALGLTLLPLSAHAQYASMPGVRVTIAPPPARVEVQPARPSSGHVWIAGHWAWRGGRHFWAPGHWSLPPGGGYGWVAARWENVGGQWMFYEGHWQRTVVATPTVAYEPPPPTAEVAVEEAPPEAVAELRPAAPFAGAVWIPGYWAWHGRHHVWVGGHWSAPRAGNSWEADRWEHRGRQWVHVRGHWHHD